MIVLISLQVKNFENWLAFGKVRCKSRVVTFTGHDVVSCGARQRPCVIYLATYSPLSSAKNVETCTTASIELFS